MSYSDLSTNFFNSPTGQNSKPHPLVSLQFQNLKIDGNSSLSSFFQSYAPIILNTGSSNGLQFYGDSITLGLHTPFGTNWPTLICNHYNVNQNNFAVSGTKWTEGVVAVYNNHITGMSSFFGFGFNDCVSNASSSNLNQYSIPYETFLCAESLCLYSMLPGNNIINARSSSVTHTGTWTNNSSYNNVGLSTSTTGTSLNCNVSGRYVGFCTSIPATATGSFNPMITTTVDGNYINQTNLVMGMDGNQYTSLWIYDTITGANQSHNVNVYYTGTNGAYNGNVNIDWFFGFNQNQTGCNSAILNAVETFESYTNFNASDLLRVNLNRNYKQLSRKHRLQYGLPLYFCDETGYMNNISMTFDGVHPITNGHYYIYNRIQNVLNNGMYNYLDS